MKLGIQAVHRDKHKGANPVAVLTWVLLLFPVLIAVYQGYHPPPHEGYPPDFAIFRTAAEMVRSGAANSLYDIEMQRKVFAAVVGSSYRQFLIWNHPPVEAVIYLPFAWWNFETGVAAMRAINCLLTVAVAFWAALRIRTNLDRLFMLSVILMISLRPLSGTISTGQNSLWVMFIILTGLTALLENRYTIAVILLSFASVKFTVMGPLLLFLFVLRFRRLVLDVVLGTILIWLVPIILFGPSVFTSYIRLAVQLLAVDGEFGMHSGLLWNLRGILHFVYDPRNAFLLTIPILIGAAVGVRWVRPSLALPISLLSATFLSPHVYQHDALMYTAGLLLFLVASNPGTRGVRSLSASANGC